MQPLTAPPRAALTEAQVRALLTADSIRFDGGIEILNPVTGDVEDIGTVQTESDLVGGQIRYDNRVAVHGSLSLQIQRRLAWGRDRVRPYLVATAGEVSAKFYRGVFITSTPNEQRGETPATYDVTCYDLMSLFQNVAGDTLVTTAETTYFDALTAIHAAAATGTSLLLPGELAERTLPATRVWALYSPGSSWLRMMTDLLFEAGYTAPWADESGSIRTRPIQDTASRASEWPYDTRDQGTDLVHPDRTLTIEASDIPNWWKFIWSDKPGTPVEGNGIYTTENLTDGDSSQESLGQVVRKVVYLQAESHAALVAQGDKIKAADMAAEQTYTLTIDPLPIMGFDDVVTYTDTTAAGDVEVLKLLVATWSENLDGSPGQLVLGGPPRPALDEISASGRATVISAAPLRVVVDGATVDSFANALDGAAYDIGDRVTVTIRNPLPPLVQGVES